MSTAEIAIDKGTGTTFRLQYVKGKTATANIKTIIDLLQTLKSDLNKLCDNATVFYTTSKKAATKNNFEDLTAYINTVTKAEQKAASNIKKSIDNFAEVASKIASLKM